MMKGSSCPKCGGSLEIRQFTDAWDCDGNPSDVFEDPYCPNCKLRWIAMEREPDKEVARAHRVIPRRKNKELPACPFPKGKEAGITCSTVSKIWVENRFIYVCSSSECEYFEDTG